ncbi:MAG: 1-acyl-sn-glycerol-3-phosphate acyltransferase, partial [Novosphingobium sp.]
MVALLLACLPPYYIFAFLRLHNPWPRAFLAGVCWIAGVQIKVVGERPKGSAFLIANHVSWIDIPAIAQATGSAFVGHDGLASVPLIKHLCA